MGDGHRFTNGAMRVRHPVMLSDNNPLSTPPPSPSTCNLGIESLGHVPAERQDGPEEEEEEEEEVGAGGDLSASSHALNS